jgi:RNA polymerase sigma-70 factor, ECF subfamily
VLVIPAPRLRAGLADPAGPEPAASMPLSTATAVTGFTGRPRSAGAATTDRDAHGTAEVAEPVVAEDPATVAALAAASGDPAAQHRFVRLTQAEVWRFVAGLVDPASADDLTQETYLRALRALPSFEGRSTARTWLLGIARRTCADHIRTLQRRRRFETVPPADPDGSSEPPGAGWDRAAGDHASWHSAVDLLRALPEDRRAAFLLTQLAGLSYAEVAQVEGVPVGTIRSRVARARTQLIDAVRAARSS